MIITYHIYAFAAGFILDLLLGDPHKMPHPIRLIGRLIAYLEKKWNSQDEAALAGGRMMVNVVLLIIIISVTAVLAAGYIVDHRVGIAVEAVLTYYILAARSLYDESMKVCRCLEKGDIEAARSAVSMIVGRDTKELSDIGIAKAAIETVAENTSDGVIAPMLYTAVGGPVLGFIYKAVNTMDSMVGYKNERYINFGMAAALKDDGFNYLPSRISAYLMMFACMILFVFGRHEFDAAGAYEIHKRDSRKHESPNSAQTESTCAGALGIQLAGDASYFGVVHKKPHIGDALRPVEYADIRRANALMLMSAVICELLCIALMLLIRMLF